MRKVICTAVLMASCIGSAYSAEIANLRNGFSIRHDHHENLGAQTRLFLDSGTSSFVDIATSEITGFEKAPDPVIPVQKTATVHDHITTASAKTGVDEDFITSVIQAESGFHSRAVSPKGAQGLMQLMPETASKLGVKDSFDPAENIRGGSQYLRELLIKYNGDAAKALAAYNAGPGRVQQYHGIPPYSETRKYVARIISDYNRRKKAELASKSSAKSTKNISR